MLVLATQATSGSCEDYLPHPLFPVPISQVVINDAFWSPKIKTWREVTIPDCLGKFEKDGTLLNFDHVRDGRLQEKHHGPPWYDGLLYEMIRGCADYLATQRDPALEQRIDGYIERVVAAQAKDPDGYVNTYTQLQEPTHRWGLNGGNDLHGHDVYNAGAMVEAGVHYYRATGKTTLLKAAVRFANHMCDVIGPAPKHNVIPGHSAGEESLARLYELFHEQPELKKEMGVPVDERRYLALAEFFIEARGHYEGRKSFGAYGQDHEPVFQQQTIEGHAVRATLMGAGVSALASINQRAEYQAASRRLWENMTTRRMHVTGGVGTGKGQEAFGGDYELPNNAYLETCAAIASGFFSRNMNLLWGDARCVDELERTLYNAVLAGVSLKGDSYFYTNPLEANKDRVRWSWHECPCCPPMFLKITAALPGYIYAQDEAGIYVNLFIGSQATLRVRDRKVALKQTTQYPWQGEVKLKIEPERDLDFALHLRLPGWCAEPLLEVNGQRLPTNERVRGYARVERKWRAGDEVSLVLPMPVQRLKAHPKVGADVGRVALQRGPLVYCLEGVDNGGHVRNLVFPPQAQVRAEHRPDLLGGLTVIRGQALGLQRAAWPASLYLAAEGVPGVTPREFTAIPYFANANREPCEVLVWLAEAEQQAAPLPMPTLASTAKASASFCAARDTVSALSDQLEPATSDDTKVPRFTWFDHRGTREWVQYEFEKPARVSAVEVYWWDERRIKAQCRVPQSWRLLYKSGGEWRPVPGLGECGTRMDQYNRVTFPAITAEGLRIEAQLQPGWSGGILEWRVE